MLLLVVVGTKKYTTPDNSFDQFCGARKHIQSIKKKNLNVVAGGGWHKKKYDAR